MENIETIEELASKLGSLKKPVHYKNWCDVRNTMTLHTQALDTPETLKKVLFRGIFENTAELTHRIKTYECITQDLILRAINTVARIFQSAKFTINNIDEDTKNYINSNRFYGQDLMSYLQFEVLQFMIEDPNGLIVWLPGGQGLKNAQNGVPNMVIDPYPKLISSNRIKYISEDWAVWECGEYEETKEYGTKTKEFYVIGKSGFYEIEIKATNTEIKLIYAFGEEFDRLPITVLGGAKDTRGFYTSFFWAFKAFANDALRSYSTDKINADKCAFPVAEVDDMPCNYSTNLGSCNNGFINGDVSSVCPSCNGTGQSIKVGIFNAIVRPAKHYDSEKTDNRPLIEYRHPQVEILNYLKDSWRTNLEYAEKAINLSFVLEPQSGVAKTIDREGLLDMLNSIATNIYDRILYDSIIYIEKYRLRVSEHGLSIHKPTNFTLYSESELQLQAESASKNSNQLYTTLKYKELIDRQYNGDDILQKVDKVLSEYDPLRYKSTDEQTKLLVTGAITSQDIRKSVESIAKTQELIRIKGQDWFVDTDITVIKAELDKLITNITPVILV